MACQLPACKSTCHITPELLQPSIRLEQSERLFDSIRGDSLLVCKSQHVDKKARKGRKPLVEVPVEVVDSKVISSPRLRLQPKPSTMLFTPPFQLRCVISQSRDTFVSTEDAAGHMLSENCGIESSFPGKQVQRHSSNISVSTASNPCSDGDLTEVSVCDTDKARDFGSVGALSDIGEQDLSSPNGIDGGLSYLSLALVKDSCIQNESCNCSSPEVIDIDLSRDDDEIDGRVVTSENDDSLPDLVVNLSCVSLKEFGIDSPARTAVMLGDCKFANMFATMESSSPQGDVLLRQRLR